MKTIVVVLVLGLLLVGGFFLYQSMSSPSPSVTGSAVTQSSSSSDVSTTVITIKASRWQYDPGVIHVKKGDHVKLVIDNTDTQHGIVIPGLGVKGIDSVEFTADTIGTFDFHCPTFCGDGHREMAGTLIVEE